MNNFQIFFMAFCFFGFILMAVYFVQADANFTYEKKVLTQKLDSCLAENTHLNEKIDNYLKAQKTLRVFTVCDPNCSDKNES